MENNKRFSYLTSEIDMVYHEAARKLGVSDSVMRILYAICLNGESASLSDIVQLSAISKQTINSALRKLEQSGAVETDGGKKKQVRLTQSGKRLAEQTAMRVLDVEHEIFNAWTKEELEQYIGLTEKFCTAFQKKIKELSI